MEFKYTKGSKTLEDLSQQYIEQENTRRLKDKEEKYAKMEKEGYLHSAQELIDYDEKNPQPRLSVITKKRLKEIFKFSTELEYKV